MIFRPELIDELLKDYRNPEDLMGEDGIFKQLTKALIERCLSAELDSHLAQEKAEPAPEHPKNRRNGHSKKTIQGEFGKAEIGIPRDPLANIFRRETLLQIWLPMAPLNPS